MAAGIVYHNITTASGVTFALACYVPDTSAPDVGAIPVSLPITAAGVVVSPLTDTQLRASAVPVSQSGTWESKLVATANGLTSSRVNSAASTNATSLKGSAGRVGQIDVFNVAAYDVFLKFYNKASAPTVGTDTPVWTIPIKAGTGYSGSFPFGKSFATGIAYAVTKVQADTDTTAVAASDLTGSIDWI